MYLYASLATLGDDVYHEPSTIALEAHMAQLTGKEAAIFLPSGTMSNQIALRTHLKQPPYAVLCDQRAHINTYVPPARVSGYLDACDSGTRSVVPPSTPAHTHTPSFPRTVRLSLTVRNDVSHYASGHHITLEEVKAHAVLDHNIHK